MKSTIPSLHLNDGRQAFNFVPELNADQQLAVVDVDVLKYLVELLPKADIAKIMQAFHEKTEKVETIEQWCALLQNELNFHASVNMLQQHLLPAKPEPELVQKVAAH